MTRRVFLAASGTALVMSGCGSGPVPGSPSTRFGLFTDAHYADRDPANNRYYRDSADKIARCVNGFNEGSLDFAIELGDFKDQDATPTEERTIAYLRHAEGLFKQFKGPRYHVLGNHDMDGISKAQFQAEIENTGIEASRTFYAFDTPVMRGIVLDACFTSEGKDYERGQFDWKDANIPKPQLAWLESTLNEGVKPAVVFCHQRLDGEGDLFVKNASDVRAVLEKSGKVRAVFQGHDHRGARETINGILYLTLQGMVEGPGPANVPSAVVEIHATGDMKVEING